MAIRSAREYRLTTIQARKFEQALASARKRSPSSDVDPRMRQATIEALESELAVLREQLATFEALNARI